MILLNSCVGLSSTRSRTPLFVHLYTGSSTPPFVTTPVFVYSCTSSGSWIHVMCFSWDSQISQIRSASKSGTPRVSHPCSPWNVSSKSWISWVVSFIPRVFLRQWVASSFLLICLITSSSLGSFTPLLVSSQCLACFKSCMSSWLRSKIHWERRPRKMAYIGWDSVVQPTAMFRIKCQMLRDFTISDHWEKRSFVFTAPPPQQSQST